MITAAILGWAVVAGVDRVRLLGILAVVFLPVPSALAIAGHVWRSRPKLSTRAATFCEAVAAEMRSGASLRMALGRAAGSVGAPRLEAMCREGAPFAELSIAIRSEFDEIGVELAAAVERVSRLGAPSAGLFDELGVLALAQVEVAHEVAVAAAPARATSFVLLSAPVIAIGWVTATGRLGGYLAEPAQRVVAMIGLGLTLVGCMMAVVIMRRAR